MLLKTKPIAKGNEHRPVFMTYIHYLRGLAILLIVGIHCRTSFQWQEDSFFRLFFEATLDNGTIIFVFISGFLFEHLFAKNFNFRRYFDKKLKYVVGPYLLVSIIPIVDKLYFEQNLRWLPEILVDQSDLAKSFYMLITGKHFGPYWFIPMIVIFYLISPLLVWVNKLKFYAYIFPVIFVLGLFTYKFGYYSNTFDSFLYFLPVYLFGMATSYYKEWIIAHREMLLYPLVFLYIIITGLELMGYIKMHKLIDFDIIPIRPYYTFSFNKLKVSFLCIALLLIFYNLRNKKIFILKILGDYSFGIYFIHLYFVVIIQLIVHAMMDSFEISTSLFLAYTLLVTSLSIGSVYTIKKIFGNRSRYLIGS